MTTINHVLEISMQLDFSGREMLIEILQKRQVEERRKEIAANSKKAKTALKNKKIQSMTSVELINRLNNLI